MDTSDGVAARPLEVESNGKQEASISNVADSPPLPSDLLLAHNAAVSCVRLAMQIHKAATSDAFYEKADVELLVDLGKKLWTARPLILAVSKKLSSSQFSRKARAWYNSQPIIEDNAHLVALEIAFSLYVGCWGAGDPRGLAAALVGRAYRNLGAVKESERIPTINREAIELQSRHKQIRAYLCSVKPFACQRVIEAMRIEVEEAAKSDRETAPINLIRKPFTDHSSTTNDANVAGSDLFAASDGTDRLLSQLKTLRHNLPYELEWSRFGRGLLLPELLASLGTEIDEGALALVQGKLAEARQGKVVRAAMEERETAALAVLALWRRVLDCCSNSGVFDCFDAAVSAAPLALKTDDRVFQWMLKQAVGCVLNNYPPKEPDCVHNPDWMAFYDNLRLSEDFQLAVGRVDSSRLVRELAEILDFEPGVLEAELKLEFRDLLANEKRPARKDGFLDFPTKQRRLLDLLQGEGNVPIPKITQTLYGRNGSLDTLLKLKKDTNRNLATKRPGYEIRKQGDTLLLGNI